MKRLIAMFIVVLLAFALVAGCAKKVAPPEDVVIEMWTQENEKEALPYLQALAAAYTAAHPNVTFEIVSKETEVLREDFQTSSLAGNAPDLLWTVSDHAGPFVVAQLIQPVDSLINMNDYVESVVMDNKTWAVPIAAGNHLTFLYNKKFVAEAPADSDAMIALAKQLQADKKVTYGLVFNQLEPFWLVPFLGGFNGKVFAADGVTPTLNTPEMIAALQFFYDLKFTHKIVPVEADYSAADTLFKEGKAAMLINGDWSFSDYATVLGADLGIARIPMIKSTGKYPAPYTAGKYYMIAADVTGAKLEACADFIKFATNYENQIQLVTQYKRLPGLKAALADPVIANDPILKGSAEQMSVGTPQPNVLEMRAVWDAMKPEMNKVWGGKMKPADAAVAMQAAAEAGIAAQK